MIGLLALGIDSSLLGQNVVQDNGTEAVLPPLELTDQQVTDFLLRVPEFQAAAPDANARRIAGKLNDHVTTFLDGFPWQAFHHTLGISGYESYFAHPDELFLAVGLALPYLPSPTRARANAFLKSQLAEFPPYALDGFDRRAGRARENYDVPESLRLRGRARARNALGVYSFWLYCQNAPEVGVAHSHWPKIRERMQSLLANDYKFDPKRSNEALDRSEDLNGDLAGLLGLWRLARLVGDAETESKARHRAGQLLGLRVNLERINARFVEGTRTANRSLHAFKLTRYCSLVPEVADVVRSSSGGLAVARLKEFRTNCNAWWLAFGDRFIGGENYTNPPHFVRSLFTGAACIEQLSATELSRFVDVPWCAGDFYFIEKCALALWAASNRTWKNP